MSLYVVITGLVDPAIHAELPLVRFAVVSLFGLVSMDHRLKPGSDDNKAGVTRVERGEIRHDRRKSAPLSIAFRHGQPIDFQR